MTPGKILATACAAAFALTMQQTAFAQSATTSGAGGGSATGATAGTAGSAAASGNTASTVGLGATSGEASALGGAAAASSLNGHTQTQVHDNGKSGQARAQAMDQGTFAKSHTHTKIKKGAVVSRTKSMSHVPGSKPVMSTTSATGPTPPQ